MKHNNKNNQKRTQGYPHVWQKSQVLMTILKASRTQACGLSGIAPEHRGNPLYFLGPVRWQEGNWNYTFHMGVCGVGGYSWEKTCVSNPSSAVSTHPEPKMETSYFGKVELQFLHLHPDAQSVQTLGQKFESLTCSAEVRV